VTPDDWQDAMQNEADAAPDPQWAHNTRRTARRWRWGRWLTGEFLAGQPLLAGLALVCLSPRVSPTEPGLWLALAAVGLTAVFRYVEGRKAPPSTPLQPLSVTVSRSARAS
jgi:hypothetical protein